MNAWISLRSPVFALLTGCFAVMALLAGISHPASAQGHHEPPDSGLEVRVIELEDRVQQLQQLVDLLLEERAARGAEAAVSSASSAEGALLSGSEGPAGNAESVSGAEAVSLSVAMAEGPPPPTPTGSPYPQELLPKLGKIGASARLTVGSAASAAGFGRDQFFGGAATLPLRNLPGGRLNYELSVGMLRFDRPQDRSARLLEVVPFSLVYAVTVLDRYRIRPYLGAGLGNYVTLQSAPAAGAALDTGFRFAAGFDWRSTKDLSLGLDFRQNWVTQGFRYHTLGPRLSFHF